MSKREPICGKPYGRGGSDYCIRAPHDGADDTHRTARGREFWTMETRTPKDAPAPANASSDRHLAVLDERRTEAEQDYQAAVAALSEAQARVHAADMENRRAQREFTDAVLVTLGGIS